MNKEQIKQLIEYFNVTDIEDDGTFTTITWTFDKYLTGMSIKHTADHSLFKDDRVSDYGEHIKKHMMNGLIKQIYKDLFKSAQRGFIINTLVEQGKPIIILHPLDVTNYLKEHN